MLLSVCIITKNEASTIRSCLDSVKEIADEIIILDAFSTDDTVAIAKNYTTHIYQKAWKNDFSLARNFTISKATGKWILVIDADEVFRYSPKFQSQLKSTEVAAFGIIRKEMYREKHHAKKVSFPVTIIRLFRRDTNALFRYPIHERLDDFFAAHHHEVCIHHECFLEHHISTDTAFINDKQERYLTQINSYLRQHPTDEWMLYQKIKTLKFFGRNEEIKNIIKTFHPKTEKIKVATHIITSQLYTEAEMHNQAINLLQPHTHKTYTIIHLLLGDIYYRQKQFFKAFRQYRKMKTSAESIHFSEAMYIVTYCEKPDKVYKIASILYSLKLHFLCLLYLDAHKKYLQADSLLLYTLIFIKKNNLAQAKKYLKKAREKDPYWQKLIQLENKLT